VLADIELHTSFPAEFGLFVAKFPAKFGLSGSGFPAKFGLFGSFFPAKFGIPSYDFQPSSVIDSEA